MPFKIIESDITKVKADVIVNAANEGLREGSGVCGAIFRTAGETEMAAACRGIGHCATGDAVITPGFSLPAKYVIHTVGPVWQGGGNDEEKLLYSCYKNSLELAAANDLKSIAFPLISSGIFGYPKDQALDVALRAIKDFLATHDMDVAIVVLDESIIQVKNSMVQDIADYILQNVSELKDTIIERLMKVLPSDEVEDNRDLNSYLLGSIEDENVDIHFPDKEYSLKLSNLQDIQKPEEKVLKKETAPKKGKALKKEAVPKKKKISKKETSKQIGSGPVIAKSSLKVRKSRHAALYAGSDHLHFKISNVHDIPIHVEKSFSEMLFRFIDGSGKSDPEIYKAANIDRKLFSKLRKPDYIPSKKTVLQLSMALELNLDQTKDILAKAGYAFSDAQIEDLVIKYFIEHEEYDTLKLEAAIFHFCGHYWTL